MTVYRRRQHVSVMQPQITLMGQYNRANQQTNEEVKFRVSPFGQIAEPGWKEMTMNHGDEFNN